MSQGEKERTIRLRDMWIEMEGKFGFRRLVIKFESGLPVHERGIVFPGEKGMSEKRLREWALFGLQSLVLFDRK